MKKIVILALHLGVGGVEKVIANTSNILCENYEVSILSTYNIQDKPAFKIDDRVKIKYLINDLKPNKQEFLSACRHFNIIQILKQGFKSIKILYLRRKTMIEAIRNIDADIVISTRILFNKWLSKNIKKGTIKIAQEHRHHNNNNKYIKKLIKSLKNIDFFMPPSKELADFYTNQLKDRKTEVIYIPTFVETDSKEISQLTNKTMISVGRLEKEKGFFDLIDVFKIVNEKYPEWTLKIVGEGSKRKGLQEKIFEEKLENSIELVRKQKQRRARKALFRYFYLCYDIFF